MTASGRGSKAAASIIRSWRRHPHPLICSDCISHLTSRGAHLSGKYYSIAGTALQTDDAAPNSSLLHLQTTPPISSRSSSHAPKYTTKAGILLSRAPLLTAPQTSFEKAYFFYQKRLNERLAMPFTPYFYFKSDTPADTDRKIKARERNGVAARELGGYRAYGDEAWNDELLSSDSEAAPAEGERFGKMGMAEPKYVIERLVKDAKVRAVEGKDGAAVEVKEGEAAELGAGEVKVERPLSRFTQSDRVNDVKRLDRQLTRTLYLLVKSEDGGWGFPSGELVGRENLHQAAERIIVQAAGVNMNTWVVGKVPVGHYIKVPRYFKGDTSQLERVGEKHFFLKGRIMAGQADLTGNELGYNDFKWLTKQEVGKHVSTQYYSYVKNMLADR
ncbi:50S ribosomal subunit L30 [Diplocarpon rosae]|nr:50S ribosomal subunit L30 [Diplocarpon rosae]